jgi:3-carboxy-cis,cis-muconate cycloisomerase
LPSDDLFTPIFVPAQLRAAVSDRAWVQAMLDAERALAAAEARAGVIPVSAADAIAKSSRAELFDLEQIGLGGRHVGNPVEPLVRALTAEIGGDAGRYVHWGATSQDILDTAAMLVARSALDLILADLDGVATACAALAETHRSTLVAGRTLLQQALPTTFGLKAAGWLVGTLEARRRLASVRSGLPAELGGAAGTLASLGERGPEVLRLFAEELDLAEPVLPWHTNRVRFADLGSSLDAAAGFLAKIALDVALLAQTEVAEVAEPASPGRGGSSTMPHKRNPVGSALAAACARQVHAASSVLTGGLAQEHERAAGAWQAEWQSLASALALTGGAAASIREVLEGLEVDAERMRRNLDATDGLIMAERVSFLLAERIGRSEAHELVTDACARAVSSRRALRDELASDERVAELLSAEQLDAAFDPAGYVGSAEAFVDRALDLYRRERS